MFKISVVYDETFLPSIFPKVEKGLIFEMQRQGNRVAEYVKDLTPQRALLGGGSLLVDTIDCSPVAKEVNLYWCGIGDKTKMPKYWYYIEHGLAPNPKYGFMPMEGWGKHGEGAMIKLGTPFAERLKLKSHPGIKPVRMFEKTYRELKDSVVAGIDEAVGRALK